MERFSLTTPISDPSSTSPIGRAYTTIAADVLVHRHPRRRHDSFLLTGTDENASENVRPVAAAGVDPGTSGDRLVGERRRPLRGRVGVSPGSCIGTTGDDAGSSLPRAPAALARGARSR